MPPLHRYRKVWTVCKILAALLLAYALANVGAIALSWLLPGQRANAVMIAIVFSFLCFALIIIGFWSAGTPGGFRQSLSGLHSWAGLVLGWLLYFMFVTGTLGYFNKEIDRWMQPEIPMIDQRMSQSQLLPMAEQRLQVIAPNAPHWFINFPVGRYPYLLIQWQQASDPENTDPENTDLENKAEWQEEILNPATGQPLIARKTGGGQTLYLMHYALHYMPQTLAYCFTSLAALFMLLALLTGIVIHKKIFKAFFTFRPAKKPRAWLDMHNLLSVLPLPFHLMMTYSGLVLLMSTTMPGVIAASYGLGENNQNRFFDEVFSPQAHHDAASIPASPFALQSALASVEQRWGKDRIAYIGIDNRGDSHARIDVAQAAYRGLNAAPNVTYNGVTGELQQSLKATEASAAVTFYELLLSLHEGNFAATGLRWLYFFSGLLGAGMVATGLILWAAKRRQVAEKKGYASRGLMWVERLNAGAIAGLPIAIAVYFWANRLLPLGLVGRAEWEVHSLFITLAACLLYPLFRSTARAWVELLSVAALLFGLLPLANVLLTDRHLAISLRQGDWVMVGVDLALLGAGILLALAAFKVRRVIDKPQLLITKPKRLPVDGIAV